MNDLDRRLREAGQSPVPPPRPGFRRHAGGASPGRCAGPRTGAAARPPARRRRLVSRRGRSGRTDAGTRIGRRPAGRWCGCRPGGVGHRHRRRPARRDRWARPPRVSNSPTGRACRRERRPPRRRRHRARPKAGSPGQERNGQAVPHHRSPKPSEPSNPPDDGFDGHHAPRPRDPAPTTATTATTATTKPRVVVTPTTTKPTTRHDRHQAQTTTSTSGPTGTVAALKLEARYRDTTAKLQWSAYQGREQYVVVLAGYLVRLRIAAVSADARDPEALLDARMGL